MKNIINEAQNSKLDLKSFLVGEAIQNEYEQQLDQLKASLDEKNDLLQKLGISATGEFKRIKYYVDKLVAENEELKVYKSITPLKVKKLVKALTEIKEIAEEYEELHGFLDCSGDLILQKISEVMND